LAILDDQCLFYRIFVPEITQSQDVKEHMHEHLHYVAGDDCASFLFAGLPAAVRGFQGNTCTLKKICGQSHG
jgi:hypothetical protein